MAREHLESHQFHVLRTVWNSDSRDPWNLSPDSITMPAPLDPSKLWLFDDQGLGRKEPDMMIIGIDYHPSFQTIAFLIEETGECGERELNHSDGEAERFYRERWRPPGIHAGSSDYLQSWVSSCGLE